MQRLALCVVCVAVFGCSNDGKDKGGSDGSVNNGPDAKQFLDAPATQNAMITITGNASERSAQGGGALAGVKIEAFRNSNETTAIAMTTTDAQGNYSLTIPTNGEAIDGFLKATLNQYKTTYLYPPFPLALDFSGATVIMVKPATYDLLYQATTTTEMAGKGVVAMVVTDGTNPIAGAVATSTPSTPDDHYNEMVGAFVLPTANATSTYTDGIAYLFNLPAGQATVGATKPNMTFASHTVKVWPGDIVTTVIVP